MVAAVETARAELVEKLAEVDDELGEMFIMEQVRQSGILQSRASRIASNYRDSSLTTSGAKCRRN